MSEVNDKAIEILTQIAGDGEVDWDIGELETALLARQKELKRAADWVQHCVEEGRMIIDATKVLVIRTKNYYEAQNRLDAALLVERMNDASESKKTEVLQDSEV